MSSTEGFEEADKLQGRWMADGITEKPEAKPREIKYSVEDKPPFWQALLLILQHVLTVSGALVIPSLIARESGGTAEDSRHLVSVSLLAMGFGTILQANRRVGSGYLCTAVCGAEFVPASILAIKLGGYGMLSGMLVLTALFQACCVPVITRLRHLFPVEVTGVVIFMTGISLVKYSATGFLGIHDKEFFVNGGAMLVAMLTLALLVTACVWGRGVVRQYALLAGVIGGGVLSHFINAAPTSPDAVVTQASLFAVPLPGLNGWSWNPALMGPFLIAGLCSVLGTLGNITACQKINTVNWRRPDMGRLSRGVLAESLGNLMGGLFGSAGLGSSASSAGLGLATGVTSRHIGTGVGLGYIILAFFPGLISRFAELPGPVLDACLVFSVSFIMLAGLQIFLSRMIDIRKTFVIGFSIVAGLYVEMNPGAFHSLPSGAQPFFSSALSISAIVAIVLNLIFRLGMKRTEELRLEPKNDYFTAVKDFLESRGATWGMRRDVVSRAEFALLQYVEMVSELPETPASILIAASFDEFHFDLEISYTGKLIDLCNEMPSLEEDVAEEAWIAGMAGSLVRRHADKVSGVQQGDLAKTRLYFEH